jgi:hypothetical protein
MLTHSRRVNPVVHIRQESVGSAGPVKAHEVVEAVLEEQQKVEGAEDEHAARNEDERPTHSAALQGVAGEDESVDRLEECHKEETVKDRLHE